MKTQYAKAVLAFFITLGIAFAGFALYVNHTVFGALNPPRRMEPWERWERDEKAREEQAKREADNAEEVALRNEFDKWQRKSYEAWLYYNFGGPKYRLLAIEATNTLDDISKQLYEKYKRTWEKRTGVCSYHEYWSARRVEIERDAIRDVDRDDIVTDPTGESALTGDALQQEVARYMARYDVQISKRDGT